jgi:hypothetical protein
MGSDKGKKFSKGESKADAKAPDEVKIPHHRSPHFSSHFATNTIVSGPTTDGIYHLIFSADAIGLLHETANLVDTGAPVVEEGMIRASYKTHVGHDDLEYFREDKARISLTLGSLTQLRDLLNRLFPAGTSGND